MTGPKYICPSCQQRMGVDIAYGMPDEEMIEMAERHEIALGGCCVAIDGPERRCLSCGHEWRTSSAEVASE